VLDHEYTEESLSYDIFEGPDLSKAFALRKACEGRGFIVRVATMARDVIKSIVDEDWGYRGRDRYCDDEDGCDCGDEDCDECMEREGNGGDADSVIEQISESLMLQEFTN
jgi:hypothetical protein